MYVKPPPLLLSTIVPPAVEVVSNARESGSVPGSLTETPGAATVNVFPARAAYVSGFTAGTMVI